MPQGKDMRTRYMVALHADTTARLHGRQGILSPVVAIIFLMFIRESLMNPAIWGVFP